MEKMMNKKTEGNTFTKKIGQTVLLMMYLQLWGVEQLSQETYQQECVEKEKMRVFIKQMEVY